MESEIAILGIAATRTVPLVVESDSPEQFALFPAEYGGGVTISQDEMLQLSRVYSGLYEIYISRLSARLASRFDISEQVAKILVRRALVPLIHCFLDRLVRVKKAIDSACGRLSVPRQKPFPIQDTIEVFEDCVVSSPAFNQWMIRFVGHVWQLPESDAVHEQQPFAPQLRFKNNTFTLYSRTAWQLARRACLKLMALLPRPRFPTLTMANATEALFYHGFYSDRLGNVSQTWPLEISSSDRDLRDYLFSDDDVEHAALSEFLVTLGLSAVERRRACGLFNEFLYGYYPASLLEAIPQNMRHARKALQPFKQPALISSDGRGSSGSYIVAAAKEIGLTIVDHQHGGHYGYIEDMSQFLELEYPGVDQFVSWGWSRLPDHPAVKGLSVIDLPSPWLSERKRYWAGLSVGREKEFDILLMPNLMRRFPAASRGASTARIDLVQEVAASLNSIVRAASAKNIRVLHKPYNLMTANLFPRTMRELETIGGSYYACEQELDKGLTYELLQRCHIVLWDQPGTGFLECLVSKIPTIVYWPRLYNHEEAWLKPLFSELEQCGIVHRDVDLLIEEFQRFKKSPDAWMKNPERVSLISRFCREFAWTSDEWPKCWRRFLDGLANDSSG